MRRRNFTGLALALPWVPLSGCVTTAMHEEHVYAERLLGVLISADRQSLVVVGEKYHYIFSAPPQVLAALDEQLQPGIEAASFQSFRVTPDHKIQGKLVLQTKRDASPAQVAQARQAGFEQRSGRWVAEAPMRGERFTPRPGAPLPLQKLSQAYEVRVTEAPSGAVRALKAAATPVTVAADGVLVIGAVVLSPILLPLLLKNLCFVCGNAS